MKYPSVYLMEEGAHGEVLSIAFAGAGQHQDAGGKIVHGAPNTTSKIISKSISRKQLAKIIEPRMDEILRLVKNEIRKCDYLGEYTFGIVLTGGGALLKD